MKNAQLDRMIATLAAKLERQQSAVKITQDHIEALQSLKK